MSDMSNDPNAPRPRDPVDPRGAATPPPPPPPGAGYGYGYPPPPPERKGVFGGLTKIGGVISMAMLLFIVGFYAALIVMNQGSGPSASTWRAGDGKEKVAIIPVTGIIGSNAAEFVRNVVDQIIEDESIKAVVLRVDSPGGDPTASDEIYHDLARLRDKRKMPIVASYGSAAASGGYYVSCGADYIFVQPTTITGSIGVLSMAVSLQGLEDKTGINIEQITATHSKEKDIANDTFRPWTPEDTAELRTTLDVMYDQFVDVVYDGRKSKFATREDVMKVATGRVYMAQGSIDAKLTDEIGYLDSAVDKAVALGGLAQKKPPVVIYKASPGLRGLLGVTARPAGSESASGWSFDLSFDAASVRRILTELSVPKPAYLMQR